MHTQLKSVSAAVVRALLVPVTALSLCAAGLVQTSTLAVADTSPASADVQATVGADPLPTTQMNGVAWAQTVKNNVVYVGGKFTKARPAGVAVGQQEVVRNNFLAYDLTTGELLPFAPSFNGQIKDLAVSPDGKTLYVAGQFTSVNGADRYRAAAFDIETGNLLSWSPSINASVNAIEVTDTQVFVGGVFTKVNGQTRARAAAIDRDHGNTVSAFSPNLVGGDVQSITISPDNTKIVYGGSFTTANGSSNPGYGLVMLNPQTGASLPTAVNSTIRVAGSYGAIMDLDSNETGFYGGAFSQSSSTANLEGTFRADWSGNMVWVNDCHGDTYGVHLQDNSLYTASHAHYCGNVGGFPQTDTWTYYPALAFTVDTKGIVGREHLGYNNFEGNARPDTLVWFPDLAIGTVSGLSQAAWSVSGEGDYVVYAGEFPKVNNTAQQGLVRFAKKSVATSKVPPVVSSNGFQFTPYDNGDLNVAWTAATDKDNARLTYRLYRDGALVAERQADSTFYNITRINAVDSGLKVGTKYTYQLRVSDPDGNVAWAPSVSYTYSSGVVNTYDRYIMSENPVHYYRFEELKTPTLDTATGVSATVNSRVSMNMPGVNSTRGIKLTGGANTSTVIPGTAARELGSNNFSVEAWFKTTSTAGGAIMSFGNATSGNSSSMDRVIYLSRTGQVYFGVKPGQVRTINSSASYNDGQYHHVAASLSAEGMKLYVDGKLVASRADTVNAFNFTGVWRIGGDSLTGWTSAPSTSWLAADLDSPAVYSYALTADQVSDHNQVARTGIVPNSKPTSSFTATATNLKVSVDGSGSTDKDGSISSYAWDFGDGNTATGAKATHTYAAAGTYTVKLTVTDNLGATNTSQQSVTVAKAPNKAPTASFTSVVSALDLKVDGSASDDVDGTVASYAWDFGDGETGTGKTATHTYAKSGTYTVKLTVTDNEGATGTTSEEVKASLDIVIDTFTRSESNWGSTTPGGTWTYTNKSYFSTNGSEGVIRIPTAAGQGTASLDDVSVRDSDTTFNFTLDNVTTGGGVQTAFLARRNGNSYYRLTVQVHGDQLVRLGLQKQVNGVSTNLGDVMGNVADYTQGTKLNVRFVVTGSDSTTLKATVWADGTPEPTPQITRTDSAAPELQSAGSVGFVAYLASSAQGPMGIRIDDLIIR